MEMSGPNEMYKEFLTFSPTANPPWRARLKNSEDIPSIEVMLKDINSYRLIYEKNKDNIPADDHKKVIREMLISFFVHVQKEEGIGVEERGATAELLTYAEEEERNGNTLEEPMDCTEEEPLQLNEAEVHSQSSSSEPQSSLEAQVKDRYRKGEDNEKSEQETLNLCRAYLHIKKEIDEADADSIGYIDLESCVQQVHKIAMKRILPDPGKFCENKRLAKFRGETHEYPRFTSQAIAEESLMTLIDKYNWIVRDLRHNKLSDDKAVEWSFKCASLFLFALLTLHPFSDGNGRVARLLASYSMWTHCPFMTPIYNVFSSSCEGDYVQALVDARHGLELKSELSTKEDAREAAVRTLKQAPSDLCAMLIESNWAMWRQCLKQLKLLDQNLHDWEVDRSSK